MNSTITPDLEMMAKAYFSDKIAIALGSQFMGYVLPLPLLLLLSFPLPSSQSYHPPPFCTTFDLLWYLNTDRIVFSGTRYS